MTYLLLFLTHSACMLAGVMLGAWFFWWAFFGPVQDPVGDEHEGEDE